MAPYYGDVALGESNEGKRVHCVSKQVYIYEYGLPKLQKYYGLRTYEITGVRNMGTSHSRAITLLGTNVLRVLTLPRSTRTLSIVLASADMSTAHTNDLKIQEST